MRTATRLMLAALLLSSLISAAPVDETAPRVDVFAESAQGFTAAIHFAEPNLIRGGDDQLTVDIPGTTPDFTVPTLALPGWTRLVEVPNGYNLKARVVSRQDVTVELEPALPRDGTAARSLRSTSEKPAIDVGEPVWMRYRRVAPVAINPASYDAENHTVSVAREIEVEFEFIPGGSYLANPPDPERYWSLAFEELFDALLLHPTTTSIIPGGRLVTRGSYLIITDQALAQAATEFAEWKSRKGFNVVVAPIYVLNRTQAADIKRYIQDAYDNWERPPEFILLLGDANATGIRIPPADIIHNPRTDVNEDDATDQPYGYLTGDDYFIDAFVGRISCDSPSSGDALKAFARYILHERDLEHHEDLDLGAFQRATLWAANISDRILPVSTPVETSMWLAQHLALRGWDVDQFYYRNAQDDNTPGPIIESMNRGINIASYRGWADARGTHYPQFYKPHLDRLNNGPLLPVFTIFVCNTGDYVNQTQPCFGEYTITRGEEYDPRGALAFFGASDLHTSTQFNNPLLGGYYTGLLFEKMRVLGALTVRSKTEVWRGFPHWRGTGETNFVEFYFSVYNILGDPEVNLYLDPPSSLSVQHPANLNTADTRIEVLVEQDGNPAWGALVTLLKDDEVQVSMLTDATGMALLPVTFAEAGTAKLTVLNWQSWPYLTDIEVADAGAGVTLGAVRLVNGTDDGELVAGEEAELWLTLRNLSGDVIPNVEVTLSTPTPASLEIIDNTASLASLPGNSRTELTDAFRVKAASNVLDGEPLPLEFTVSWDRAQYTGLKRIPTVSTAIAYDSHSFAGGVINPGDTRDLTVVLDNNGRVGSAGVYGIIHSHDGAVSFPGDRATFGDLASGGQADCSGDPFSVAIEADARIGRQIQMRLNLFDGDDEQIGYVTFNITVGEVTNRDVLGPDSYGYYAYEDTDNPDLYPQKPEFEWIELDPDYGGEGGTLYAINDDEVRVIDLPFTFRYYNWVYNRITICDNGWFCFGRTWMANFRNWGMPSPLGPPLLVAVFWDDLTNPDPDHPGDPAHRLPVKVFTRYDQNEGRFIIEWSRATLRYGFEQQANFEETFEAILYDPAVHSTPTGDGEIVFQYLNINNEDLGSNFATVGIQDHYHRRGLEVTFSGLYPAAATELEGGRAIKFTTDAPDVYDRDDLKNHPLPTDFSLDAVYPNPFNAQLTAEFSLPQAGMVSAGLWDLSGRLVLSGGSALYPAGRHSLTLDAAALPGGLYMLKLSTGDRTAVHKTVLLK